MKKQEPKVSESADMVDINQQAEKYYSKKEKAKPQVSGDLKSESCVLYKDMHLKKREKGHGRKP